MLRKHGFTLVELLVVVSIIALLIALLLPALNQARAVAQQAVCLSNGRSIGLCFHMYNNDQGKLPYAALSESGKSIGWDDLLNGYDGRNLSSDQINRSSSEVEMPGKLYACPRDRRTSSQPTQKPRSYAPLVGLWAGSGTPPASPGTLEGKDYDHVYGLCTAGSVPAASYQYPVAWSIALSRVPQPADTIMITERLQGNGLGRTNYSGVSNPKDQTGTSGNGAASGIDTFTHGSMERPEYLYVTCDGSASIAHWSKTLGTEGAWGPGYTKPYGMWTRTLGD